MQVVYGVGNMIRSVIRFDGSVVSNAYDIDGRLSLTAYPDTTNLYSWYRNGMLRTAANELGVLSNTYDGVDRLTAQTGPAPSGAVSWTHYPAGQVSNMTSVAGATRYTLDAADRVSAASGPAGDIAFTYNTDNGLLAAVAFSNGGA